MAQLNIKRLLVLSGIGLLILLILRGLVFACGQIRYDEGQIKQDEKKKAAGDMLSLYLDREDKRVFLSVEEYLVGVVAAEMPASFNVEALKAQAVAARTYTQKRIAEGGCKSGCDLCSDSGCCQAYRTDAELKKSKGESYDEAIAKIKEAVKDTEGKVLYYEGELIEALYHSSSGGATENSENVFAEARPYLVSVSSEHEIGTSNIIDEVRYSKDEFAKAINKAFPKAKVSAKKLEKQIEITQKYESGRVKQIKLGSVSATGRELRGALELRSAMFTVSFDDDQVIITTRGYGHGVGMSQTGANGMAEEGKNYEEILKHYYTGAEIKSN